MGASALMGSSGYSGYSGLSGRNLGMWGQSALARSYSDVLGGNWELGVPFYKARDDPLNVYSWAQPPMVQAPPASQPAVEETGNAFLARSAPERQVSLATLVSSQLSGQRRLHLANGWEAFGTGDYRTACSEFALADGYGSISPAERFEARVPLLYARVAARQYAEATWCLKWMLETGSRPDLDTAGLFARLVPDLPARYGRQSDLDRHLAEIADLAMRSSNAYQDARTDSKATTELPRLSEAMWQSKALQLVFLYATPAQRSRAIFEAKSFAGAPRPWNELGKLLQDGNLDRGENPGGPPAGTGKLNIGNFPFNLSQETPPQDVLSHFPPAS